MHWLSVGSSKTSDVGNDTRPRSTRTFKDGKQGFGQNGLYWMLLRKVALHRQGAGEKRSVQKLMDEQDLLLQLAFNYTVPLPEFPMLRQPKGTSGLSMSDFNFYYIQCEKACATMWGVSPFKEDIKEFDHGFAKSE